MSRVEQPEPWRQPPRPARRDPGAAHDGPSYHTGDPPATAWYGEPSAGYGDPSGGYGDPSGGYGAPAGATRGTTRGGPAGTGYGGQAGTSYLTQAGTTYGGPAGAGYGAPGAGGYGAEVPTGKAHPARGGYPGWGAPQAYGMPGPISPQVGPACRFCGSTPAAQARFRGHQGLIVMMRFTHVDGPFCRDCGLATFRRMTSSTLLQGWWGVASFFITPVIVVLNLLRRSKVAHLGPPGGHPRAGTATAAMDPGKPLLARPAALVGMVLPVLVVAALAGFYTSRSPAAPSARVGACVQRGAGNTARLVDCGQKHDGKVTAEVDQDPNGKGANCPQGTIGWLRLPDRPAKLLCVGTG